MSECYTSIHLQNHEIKKYTSQQLVDWTPHVSFASFSWPLDQLRVLHWPFLSGKWSYLVSVVNICKFQVFHWVSYKGLKQSSVSITVLWCCFSICTDDWWKYLSYEKLSEVCKEGKLEHNRLKRTPDDLWPSSLRAACGRMAGFVCVSPTSELIFTSMCN